MFRAAQAFVEVTSQLDDGPVLRHARIAADAIDRELSAGAERAGMSMTEILARSGREAGEGWTRDARGRLHDSRGRFVAEARGIGKDMGSDLGQGLMDLFGRKARVLANPTLMSILLPAAAAVSPFAGAAIGAGLMAGLGTVSMAGGIALALRDPEIKHAATETGKEIMEVLDGAAEPFKAEVLGALEQGERSFRAWEPWIRRIGVSSAQAVEPITTGITGLVTRALPGIDRALANMRPLWSSIRDGLVETGDAVGDMFDSLSDNGAEFALAMRMIFTIINGTIRGTGMLINGLTEIFGFGVEAMLKMGDMALELGRGLAQVPGPIGEIGRGLTAVGEHITAGRPQWEEWKRTATAATGDTNAATAALTERQKLLNQSMGATVEQAGTLKAAFDLLNGAKLSAREAESNYQAALDNLTGSIKENGKTLNLNTEAGRANDSAVRTLIGTINAKAQAAYDEALATGDVTKAEQAAQGVYKTGRAELVKNLTQILGNAGAANKLADEIMGIPKSWNSDVKANTAPARTGVQSYHDWLKSVNLDKTSTIYQRMVKESGTARGGHREFAEGGPVVGGSGYRDDVDIRAMGGEWVIRKGAVRALESRYGKGIMQAINNADRSWTVPSRPVKETPRPAHEPGGALAAITGPARTPVAPTQTVVNVAPGAFALDLSSIRTVDDLIRALEGLVLSARTRRVGSTVGATA